MALCFPKSGNEKAPLVRAGPLFKYRNDYRATEQVSLLKQTIVANPFADKHHDRQDAVYASSLRTKTRHRAEVTATVVPCPEPVSREVATNALPPV